MVKPPPPVPGSARKTDGVVFQPITVPLRLESTIMAASAGDMAKGRAAAPPARARRERILVAPGRDCFIG